MKNEKLLKVVTTVYNDSMICGWEEFFGWREEFQKCREIFTHAISDTIQDGLMQNCEIYSLFKYCSFFQNDNNRKCHH